MRTNRKQNSMQSHRSHKQSIKQINNQNNDFVDMLKSYKTLQIQKQKKNNEFNHVFNKTISVGNRFKNNQEKFIGNFMEKSIGGSVGQRQGEGQGSKNWRGWQKRTVSLCSGVFYSSGLEENGQISNMEGNIVSPYLLRKMCIARQKLNKKRKLQIISPDKTHKSDKTNYIKIAHGIHIDNEQAISKPDKIINQQRPVRFNHSSHTCYRRQALQKLNFTINTKQEKKVTINIQKLKRKQYFRPWSGANTNVLNNLNLMIAFLDLITLKIFNLYSHVLVMIHFFPFISFTFNIITLFSGIRFIILNDIAYNKTSHPMANLIQYDVLSRDCSDPPYDGSNLTNRVLIRHDYVSDANSKKKLIFYCPVYVRMKVKNFSEMSLSDLSAEVNLVLTLTFNFKNIPTIIQDYIRKRIVLRFNRDEPISLGSSKSEQISVKAEDDQGVYTYTIRKILHAGMKANIFFSPFEIINLILTVKLQKAHINKEDIQDMINQTEDRIKDEIQEEMKEEKDEMQLNELKETKELLEKQLKYVKNIKYIAAYFNLMDCLKNKYAKISYSQEGTFGNYDLAEEKLDVQYTNQELSSLILQDREEDDRGKNQDFSAVNQFQNAHFTIPLYKFPLVTLSTIFIPLWLLGIINLGIFYQSTGLADRIGSISALMIAFVALIPVIRSQLPPNPKITVVEVFVYLQILTTLLCFIQSIIVREDAEYVFSPYTNGFYITSLAINMGEIITVFLAMIVHKACLEKTYNRRVGQMGDLRFEYKQWKNPACDEHFKRSLDNGSIKVLKKFDQESEYMQKISKKDKKSEGDKKK